MELPSEMNNHDDKDEEKPFEYEEALEQVNPRGLFQIKTALLLWLGPMASGVGVFVFAFAAYQPLYRCSIPACEKNVTFASFYAENETFPAYFSDAFGTESEAFKAGKQCKRPMMLQREVPLSVRRSSNCEDYLNALSSEWDNITFEYCQKDELIFDKSVVQSSLVQEFDFLCENSFLYNIYNALVMLGMLFGAFIWGVLSDHIGRKPTLMICLILFSFVGTISAFIPYPWLYGIFRFLSGMTGMGCYMIPYVMTVEMTTLKHSIFLVILTGTGFVGGELLITLEAYFIRDWFPLIIVAYAPLCLISLVIYFFVPESSRWLLSKNRVKESKDILRKIAKTNGMKSPEFRHVDSKSEQYIKKKHGIKDLMKPRTIALRTLNMMLQWFSVTVGFYGISFASTKFTRSPYLNFTFSALAEIPVVFALLGLIDVLGRRFNLILVQILCGISCIFSGFFMISKDLAILQIAFAVFGKFAASFGFWIVYTYTCELFPTSIRLTAMGNCSMVARIGGIISLLLGALREVYEPLPLWIMGSVAVLAGFLAIILPETTGLPLPMTMEEALTLEQHNRDFKIGRRQRRSEKKCNES